MLCGAAEDDEFNQLVLYADLDTQAVVWLRAWFRYLRQTGSSFGLVTVVDALRRAPNATRALIGMFVAAHQPSAAKRDDKTDAYREELDRSLAKVRSIDDDRILRRLRALVLAILRTNAFAPAAEEALAFKIDSSQVPGLPAPVPWREIWIYSPRVEGIHLRGGPVARGGIRWSDRRDDFRTEILGLMKAQLVKNAVIVPTGAKGGFYPKQLPPMTNRDNWLAEGTESYRIFIRSLLSITDNLVDGKVVHPPQVVIRDGDDPYFVVAADKGTATFSDIANGIALDRNFWLGDAFASGGSNGYDHKAMGITARGAWISVQRHFLEMGIDVQSDEVSVAGCGDMSGDVFGNGMLLSKSLKLVAAFDHRHIFIDPNPDPASSWVERKRLFDLPRSSWDDYDRKLISKGGGVYPRTEKSISLTPEARAALGIQAKDVDPATLINAVLKAPVDLLWFGGIGTYVKASTQSQADVGDPSNDVLRADGGGLRAKVIGEGANLAITQAGRIEFAEDGGRINTDFIDNSAGVDCSDNEVNIKIPLNREMREGVLSLDKRNALLARMTEDVAEIVLEDNRLQTLALSIAEAGGAHSLPAHVRTIELLEASGRLDRKVEGLESSEDLLRRVQENAGLTRPELAVVLSISKLVLQDAAEELELSDDPLMEPRAFRCVPEADAQGARRRHPLAPPAQRNHRDQGREPSRQPARAGHRVRHDGGGRRFASAGRLGVPRRRAAARSREAVAADRRGGASGDGQDRAVLHRGAKHSSPSFRRPAGGGRRSAHLGSLRHARARRSQDFRGGRQADPLRGSQRSGGAARPAAVARRERGHRSRPCPSLRTRRCVRNCRARGSPEARRARCDPRLHPSRRGARPRLGAAASRALRPADQWERLLTAGLARDFEQLRIEFLSRCRGEELDDCVEAGSSTMARGSTSSGS